MITTTRKGSMLNRLFQTLVIAFLVFYCVPAVADTVADPDFEKAMKVLEENPDHFSDAIPLLRASAAKGNVEAAYNLGVALFTEVNSPEAVAEATELFKRASDAGHARAKFNLATVYENDTQHKVAVDQIVALYRESAESGVVQAMHRLGMIQIHGEYADADITQGLSWLLLAKSYDDGDLDNDLVISMAEATDQQRKQASIEMEKLKEKLEQNPEFLSNISL